MALKDWKKTNNYKYNPTHIYDWVRGRKLVSIAHLRSSYSPRTYSVLIKAHNKRWYDDFTLAQAIKFAKHYMETH